MAEPSGALQGNFVRSRSISSRITSGPGDEVAGNVQKKGLGTINKGKTREIERFARIEILVSNNGARVTVKNRGQQHNVCGRECSRPRTFDTVSGPVVSETQKYSKNGNMRVSVKAC